jgi:hypothetical protein
MIHHAFAHMTHRIFAAVFGSARCICPRCRIVCRCCNGSLDPGQRNTRSNAGANCPMRPGDKMGHKSFSAVGYGAGHYHLNAQTALLCAAPRRPQASIPEAVVRGSALKKLGIPSSAASCVPVAAAVMRLPTALSNSWKCLTNSVVRR